MNDALSSAQLLQVATDNIVQVAQATYMGSVVSVPEWFAIIESYIGLVRRALRAQTASMELLASKLNVNELNGLGFVPLEKLTLSQRACLLDCAGKLMSFPIEQLVSEFSAVGLSRQALFPDGVPDVSPLLVLAEALPDRHAQRAFSSRRLTTSTYLRPRSQREVDRMMKVLLRRAAVETNSLKA